MVMLCDLSELCGIHMVEIRTLLDFGPQISIKEKNSNVKPDAE
jgi:hypothetical protein